MTGKERVKAAVAFTKTDRIPTAVFDGGVWIMNQAGYAIDEITALEDGGAQILADYYKEIGSDIYYVGGGCFGFALRALGSRSDFSGKGQIAKERALSSELEYFTQIDPEQIKALLLADPGIQGLVRQAKAMRQLVGDSNYISVVAGAPFSCAAQMLGVQNLMMELYDEAADLEPLFRVAKAVSLAYCQILVEAGADMVSLGDPVASGSLISPSMYEEFAYPLFCEVVREIRTQVKPELILLHMCGDTTARLEQIKEADIDILSIDAAVDLGTALEIARGSYTILGNLATYEVMETMTEAEVCSCAEAACRTAGNEGGYILGPGCDLPVAAPLGNIKALEMGAKAASA